MPAKERGTMARATAVALVGILAGSGSVAGQVGEVFAAIEPGDAAE